MHKGTRLVLVFALVLLLGGMTAAAMVSEGSETLRVIYILIAVILGGLGLVHVWLSGLAERVEILEATIEDMKRNEDETNG